MSKQIEPVPPGFHSVTPHLVVRDAAAAITFYNKAFGAEERFRLASPDGERLLHAQIRIGDSPVMLVDEFPDCGARGPHSLGGTPVTLHLYVADVDAAFERAVVAGAIPVMQPADMFWGDRYAQVSDPFGHSWSLGTHIRDVGEEELRAGAAAASGR